MKKFVVFIAALTLMSIFACKKDDDLTRTDLLCSGPWRLNESTFNPPFPHEGGSIVDRYLLALPSCAKDDIWIFNKSGTYKIDEGTSKCDNSDYELYQVGIWGFDDTEEYLYKAHLFFYDEYQILNLNQTELQVSWIWQPDTISIYNIIDTYIHP